MCFWWEILYIKNPSGKLSETDLYKYWPRKRTIQKFTPQSSLQNKTEEIEINWELVFAIHGI